MNDRRLGGCAKIIPSTSDQRGNTNFAEARSNIPTLGVHIPHWRPLECPVEVIRPGVDPTNVA
ncbi:MAG: hypothetical protein WA996_13035 [Candidatus Promineifilaceae bacterium]